MILPASNLPIFKEEIICGNKVKIAGNDKFNTFVKDCFTTICSTEIGKRLIQKLNERKISIEFCESIDETGTLKGDRIYLNIDKINKLRIVGKAKEQGKSTYRKYKIVDPSVVMFHELVHIYYRDHKGRKIKHHEDKLIYRGVQKKGFHNVNERFTIQGSKQKYSEKFYEFYENAYREALGIPSRHLHISIDKNAYENKPPPQRVESKVIELIESAAVDSLDDKYSAAIRNISEDKLLEALIISNSPKMWNKLSRMRPELLSKSHELFTRALEKRCKLAFVHAVMGSPNNLAWASHLSKQDWLNALESHDTFLFKHPNLSAEIAQKVPLEERLKACRKFKNSHFLKTWIQHAPEAEMRLMLMEPHCTTILDMPVHKKQFDETFKLLLEQATNLSLQADLLQHLDRYSIFAGIHDPRKSPVFPLLESHGIQPDHALLPTRTKILFSAYQKVGQPTLDWESIQNVAKSFDYPYSLQFITFCLADVIPTEPMPLLPDDFFNLLFDAERFNNSNAFNTSFGDELIEILKALTRHSLTTTDAYKQELPELIDSFLKTLDEEFVTPEKKVKLAVELKALVVKL